MILTNRKVAFAALLIFFPVFLFAQGAVDAGNIDWTQLGVDLGIVGGIITVVQFLKNSFLKEFPPITYLVAAMVLSGIAGFMVAPAGAPVDAIIKQVFSYMTATAWLYAVGKNALKGSK